MSFEFPIAVGDQLLAQLDQVSFVHREHAFADLEGAEFVLVTAWQSFLQRDTHKARALHVVAQILEVRIDQRVGYRRLTCGLCSRRRGRSP